ncbi:MAG: PEGA domain-containing protein [Myxococcota bacterium]
MSLRLTLPTSALLVFLLGPMLAPHSLLAQGNTEAELYFERGNEHLERGLSLRGVRKRRALETAMEQYMHSLRIVRNRNVLFNAAVALQELGRAEDAFAYYTEYLAFSDLSPEDQAEATQRRDQLRGQVAVVVVRSEPAGADVRIGRADVPSSGVTPLEVAIGEGPERILLNLPGYRVTTREVTGVLGEQQTVSVELSPTPIPVVIQAPSGGRLTVDGRPVRPGEPFEVIPGDHVIRFEPTVERRITIQPGSDQLTIDLRPTATAPRATVRLAVNTAATVIVDGAVVGEGEELELDLTPGRHELIVEADGHVAARSDLDLPPNGDVAADITLEPAIPTGTRYGVAPVLFWVGTGVAALTALGLGINALLLNGDFEDLNADTNASQAERQDARDDVNTMNLATDIAIGSAVALGVTSLILTLTNSRGTQPPSTIRLSAGPTAGGGVAAVTIPLEAL